MVDALIIDACRTPRGVGKAGKGALSDIHPQHLGATVLSALRERTGIDTAEVDDIIWGTSAQVGEQTGDIGRMSALKRFFAPAVCDAILSAGDTSILAPHRREICYVFVDLRGFTAFTDTAEPEEVQAVLGEFHAAMGALITRFQGTIDRFAGDGILIFFNDPIAVPDAPRRAAAMALEMQTQFAPLRARWSQVGYELDLGIGIAKGFATLGAFGYESRFDYSAIGAVVNLAARLCDEAGPGDILIDRRARAALDGIAAVEALGALALKGYLQPVPVFRLQALL